MGKVWVVDDDPTVADLFCKLLTETGLQVDVVHNHAALGLLHDPATEMPAVIVLDLMMPAPDGNEILRAVKFKKRPPPVVLVTACLGTLAPDVRNVPRAVIEKPLPSGDALVDAVWAALPHPPTLLPTEVL